MLQRNALFMTYRMIWSHVNLKKNYNRKFWIDKYNIKSDILICLKCVRFLPVYDILLIEGLVGGRFLSNPLILLRVV